MEALVVLLLTASALAAFSSDNFAVVQSFGPYAVRLTSSGSTMYGAAVGGEVDQGAWLLFKINTDGTGYEVINDFAGIDSQPPRNALVSSGARLYWTTSQGGVSNLGTVFSVNTDGTGIVLLKSFTGPEGSGPSPLVSSGAVLYGGTQAGGISNYGTLFRLESDGTGFQVIKQFSGADGRIPNSLVLSGTTLYGTTYYGGAAGYGTVFRINTDGSGFALLKTFTGGDGAGPGAISLSGTALYGATGAGDGTLFRINTDGTGFALLKSFIGGNDGRYPANLMLSDGILYGTTYSGGASNCGTVFQMGSDGTGYTNLKVFTGGADGRNPSSLVLSGRVLYGTSANVLFALALASNAPIIYLSPQNQVVESGGQASFQVGASGQPTLTFQWLRNGNEVIGGATSSILQITNAQPSQTGVYSVVITNGYGSITSSPVTLNVIPPGTVPVTICSEAALRAALKGGGPVTFACDGTVRLNQTIMITNDAVLDGSGHHVTISGGNHVRAFNVASNASLTLLSLSISTAVSPEGTGGAIYNQGTLNATNCTFRGNSAWGPSAPFSPPPPGVAPTNGSGGWGGAILSLGTLNISGCSFLQNRAIGGTGQLGQLGSYLGPPNGGPGGGGGSGLGGAICSMGTVTLQASLFASNSVVGGTGGGGGPGLSYPCVFPGSGGSGGSGGSALGAGLYTTGTSTVVNCTFAANIGTGGPGGSAGSGGTSSCHGQTAHGADGSPGANGLPLGAIYDSSVLCGITNCSFAFNQGGGLRIDGGAVSLVNTLLYSNEPGGNSIGRPIDLGHNISSDASCAFTNVGSLNNTDPRLAPLADNGGPTWTMALLWASPAIDAGDAAAAPPTDQRGYARPLGLAPDIGAFEYGLPMSLQVSITTNGRVNIMVCAAPSQLCHLLASSDLVNWELFGINIAGPGGTAFFQDDTKGRPQRFYRAMLP